MTARRRNVLLRGLLLSLLILGVALMHTIGHERAGHAQASMPAMASFHAGHAVALATAPSVAAEPSATGDGDPRMPTDPATVCLTILTMLGLVVGLRLLSGLVRSGGAGDHASPGVGGPGVRGSPSLSLRLTRVVVLRI